MIPALFPAIHTFADPAIWLSVVYDQSNLPVTLSTALKTPSVEPKITFLPKTIGAASIALPASYLHLIFPSVPTAIRVPLSFPKKTVPSLITGDDFVLTPIEMLHRSCGAAGSSNSDLPERSAFPLNTG